MKKADCGIGHEREDAWGVCVPCTQSWTKSQASGRQYFSPFFSSVPFVSCFKIFKNRLFKITCADAGGLSGVTNGGPAAGVRVGAGAGELRSGVAGSLSISF